MDVENLFEFVREVSDMNKQGSEILEELDKFTLSVVIELAVCEEK